MPYDEISYDHQPGGREQEELIRKYCSGLDEHLRRARSRVEAEVVFRETCAQFDQSCESSVVRTFLKHQAQKVLEETWGKQP
ncbi:MAG TPA: hypothetical protein DEP53_08165 [Bacteroidetes bacterium]|nr:hypothetical protein [Bacteroidota bacterium]